MNVKLSPKFRLTLILFSLIGQVAWVVENMYLNVFIYKMFHASAADISAMVSASAVAATLTTVLIGALSDKIGKRKLFMCGGYIFVGHFHSQLFACQRGLDRRRLSHGCLRRLGGSLPGDHSGLRHDPLWLRRQRRRL